MVCSVDGAVMSSLDPIATTQTGSCFALLCPADHVFAVATMVNCWYMVVSDSVM